MGKQSTTISNWTNEDVLILIIDDQSNTYNQVLSPNEKLKTTTIGNYQTILSIPLDSNQNSCFMSRNTWEKPRFVIERKFGRLELRKRSK